MGKDKLKLLIVSPDLKLMGGVAETVKLLLRELEGKVCIKSAFYGRRAYQRGLQCFLMPFIDLLLFTKLLIQKKFDVIHVNPSLNFRSIIKEILLFSLFLSFGYGGRILVFFHGWEDVFFAKISSSSFFSKICSSLLNRSGVILVLAGSFKDSLVQIGVAEDKIKIVTTMVDMSDIPVCKDRDDFCTTLLYLSRIIVEKGVYEIVEAFHLISMEYPDLKLIMAGDGPEKNHLMKIVKDKGLKNVFFPGYIQNDEKFEVLRKSCIFLLPTRYGEGCPVALLEAMASGMVSIVADAGGIKDVVIHDNNALLLDKISVQSIADAVRSVLNDKEKRDKISHNAKVYAAEYFSSAKVSANIYDCYQQLLGK